MFRVACVISLLMLAIVAAQARHIHHYVEDASVFAAGGVQFVIPGSWQANPPSTSARAGQWTVPPPEDQRGDGVEVVAFFFGPGVGGSAKDNIDAWAGTITSPDGSNAPAAPQKRAVAGCAVTEVLYVGTYAQMSRQPGLPPTAKPGYALLGVVLENPGGNIYWRVTGPASQVLALAPVLDKVLDSLKPHPSTPAPTP
jgi:hypothetical protein